MLHPFRAAWERQAKYEFDVEEAVERRFGKTERGAAGLVGHITPHRPSQGPLTPHPLSLAGWGWVAQLCSQALMFPRIS